MEFLLWHHQLRESITNERLFFYVISLDTFQTGPITLAIDAFVTAYRPSIRSYAVFETLGDGDFLLRIWLPLDVSPERFELELVAALQIYGAHNSQFLAVHHVVRHHAWHEPGMGEPSDGASLQGLEPREIDAFNAAVTALQLHALGETGEGNGELLPHRGGPARPTTAKDAIELNVVAPLELGRHGIRFFMTFSHPSRPLTPEARQDIDTKLSRCASTVIADCERDWNGEGGRPRVSIYSGYGTLSSHILIGQSPDGKFYGFLRRLLKSIYEEHIPEYYRIKPTTTVTASRDCSLIREAIATSTVRNFDETLLDRAEEDETLEFKSSVWLNVASFLEHGTRESFKQGIHNVAKAVCGMLNRDGGIVVIGLAESARLAIEPGVGGDSDRWEALNIPLTEGGRLAVLGLEEEYRNNGTRRVEDWDGWLRTLQSQLQKHIAPDPFDLLCVRLTKLELSERFQRRTLGLIEIVPPAHRSSWFYIDNQFYVRHQGSTVELKGPRLDTYREALQRGTTR
jgi:hypothetical protein